MPMTFAQRLNRLFDTVYPPGRNRPYSSAEAVASVRAAGTPMSAPYLSQLRSGKRDNPSGATMEALAHFFGIDAAYFSDDNYADRLDGELDALARFRRGTVQFADAAHDAEAPGVVDIQRASPTRAPTQSRADNSFDNESFATRLNELFETTIGPTGNPYSSDEVAGALQVDGLPVTGRLISQLRAGSADRPSETTLDALAFFFNVSKDHLQDHSYPTPSRNQASVVSSGEPTHTSTTSSHISNVRIRLDDVSRCVSALAESSIRCIEVRPRDPSRARRLLMLASELSARAASSDRELVTVPTELRKRLLREWPSPDPESIVDRALHKRITTA